MDQLKFDEKTYTVKHDETDEESIDIYIKNECNFKIEYNNEGKTRFIKRK